MRIYKAAIYWYNRKERKFSMNYMEDTLDAIRSYIEAEMAKGRVLYKMELDIKRKDDGI